MQKSDPMPFSSATPTGGRTMAKMILTMSLRHRSESAESYTRSETRKVGPTRAVVVEGRSVAGTTMVFVQRMLGWNRKFSISCDVPGGERHLI